MPIIIYNKMIKRKIYIEIIIIFLFFFSKNAVFTLDREIVAGRDDSWKSLYKLNGISIVKGKFGLYDVVLKDAEYLSDDDTDLLLHFNSKNSGDEAGHYIFNAGRGVISGNTSVLGNGSLGLPNLQKGEKVLPKKGALFSPGTIWSDFSIEFWLYPATMNDGESILFWNGSGFSKDKPFLQRLECNFKKRRLDWVFTNIFTDLKNNETRIELKGITGLIPKQWSHHLLRYNSTNGLIEYLVNGRLEAVLYATSTGYENGTVLTPHVGSASQGTLFIGRKFTGLIDELRIEKEFVTTPNLTRYYKKTGTGISKIFDFMYTGTQLKKIDVLYEKPSDSGVYFYYRIADTLRDGFNLNKPWVQFVPGEKLKGIVKGRYVQIMMELYPDGKQMISPSVSEIHIIYEPDLPPAPPTNLHAVVGDGKVTLFWEAVNEKDVAGDLLYYGTGPGNYLGTGAAEGNSPIDAGRVTKFTISGLKNRMLYSFVVVSYDSSKPPHTSVFSKELTIRPSGMEK